MKHCKLSICFLTTAALILTASFLPANQLTNSTGNNLTVASVTSLIQSILGSPATDLAKGNATNISDQLNANTNFISKTAPDATMFQEATQKPTLA